MLRLLQAEVMKIRRSLIWLVVLVIPALMFGVLFLGLSNTDSPLPWQPIVFGSVNVWAFFLLPMAVTVITALLGQIEYRHNTWSYPLSLPYRKTTVLLTKALIAVALIGVISVLIGAAIFGAGMLAPMVNPEGGMIGAVPYEYLGRFILRIWLSSFLLIAVQFYVAMRFGGMALPLLTGIGGTLLAVIAPAVQTFGLSFDNGNYLPWVLPTNVLAGVPARTEMALLIGGWGGAAALVLVCGLLARKDWA